MAIAVLLVSLNVLIIINETPVSTILFVIALPAFFAIYPIVNSYINSFLSRGSKLIIQPWDYTLPFFVFISVVLLLVIIDEGSFRLLVASLFSFNNNLPLPLTTYVIALYIVYYLQFLFFLNKYIIVYKKLKIDKEYSFASRWIKYIIYGIIILELVFLFALFVRDDILFIDAVISDLIILLIGILGIKHDELLLEQKFSSIYGKETARDANRKIKSKFDSGYQREIVDQIKNTVLREKLYSNPNLHLKNFAKKLHIPEKELSIIINDNLGKNFSSFINEFRVKEACNLLADNKLKISEILLKVGFYSRSAFNTAFKEITGQTPSEFRQSL